MLKNHFILYAVIGLNILIYLAGLLGWDISPIAILTFPLADGAGWWQWLSYAFVHHDFAHLMLNMYALYLFSQMLLHIMSVWKWLVLYLLGILAGAVCQMATYFVNADAGVVYHVAGASAGVFAMMAAFAVRFPNLTLGLLFLPFEFRAKYFVAAVVGYELVAQLTGWSLFGAHIAHMAHIGGAAAGAVLAWLWRKRHIRLVK